MATSSNLHKAKNAKNDEFYTQLTDIENELKHYTEHFRNKVVFCNCDDPTWSAFWEYFHKKFDVLGLKKLIATHYDRTEPTYKMEYEGGNDNDVETGVKTPLEGNGDFRNAECIELLKESDIVVTNPPFSLFREYLAQLIEYKKDFLIIGNKNAITYKEVFPLIRDNQLWVGNTPMSKDLLFAVPDDVANEMLLTKKEGSAYRLIDGQVFGRSQSIWFTNVDHGKRHEPMQLMSMEDNLKYNKKLRKRLEKDYGRIEYPKYDNYDAIEVPITEAIPSDYDGVMGVPISFLDKYCPEQFEIVAFRKGEDGKDLIFTRERERVQPYFRILVRHRLRG
jgi:hypothetical protein